MTWQEKAKRIPPWEGCKTDDGDFVVGVYEDGWVQVRGESWDDHPESGREAWDLFAPDLAHAPTAREACAQLALFLGAPPEAVAEGVIFYHECGAWILAAGHDGQWEWIPHKRQGGVQLVPADQRALAIATAWEEALGAKGGEG